MDTDLSLALPLAAGVTIISQMDDAADVDLAAWTAGHDECAFRRLVDRHHGLVNAVCRRQLGDGDAADEATQAVFIIFARRAGSVFSAQVLDSWLYGVALSVCRRARRTAARRVRHEQEAAMLQAESQRGIADADAPFAWAELRPQLDDAIAALNANEREAVIGHFLQRLPQAAVAERLGISESAVRKRIAGALEKLRSWFTRRGAQVSAAALVAGLMGETTAAEPALAAACTQAALHPTGATAASALASGSVGAGSVNLVAAALIAALALGGGSAVVHYSGTTVHAPVPSVPQPVPPSADIVLTYDFEDGLRPADLLDGAIVAGPERTGNRFSLSAIEKPWRDGIVKQEICFAKKGEGIFISAPGTRITFDCWLAGQCSGLSLWAWDETQKTEMRLDLKAGGADQWFDISVPVDELRSQDDPVRAVAPGDLIMNLTIGAFGAGKNALVIDNLMITRAR